MSSISWTENEKAYKGVDFIFYPIQFRIRVLQSSISCPCYLFPFLYCLRKHIAQMKEY